MTEPQPPKRSASRARRQGTGLAGLPQFPPAPAVPEPFVGRARPSARALDHLARHGVVGITGVAGSGKSALAAAIAQQRAQPTVWVTLSEGAPNPIDELLWQLARPMGATEPHFLTTLEQMWQAGCATLVRLQFILAAYARQPAEVLICIDQVEQVSSPIFHSLLVGMCDYIALTPDTRIALIVVGRTLPYRLRWYTLPPLNGLEASDIGAWAAAFGLALSSTEIEQIERQTGGLPLALQALSIAIGETSGQLPLQRIMAVREIRQLVISILGTLPVEEQRTVADLAAHPDRYTTLSFETLPLIEALEEQHLVTIAPHAVLLHPLLQNYYHQLLG